MHTMTKKVNYPTQIIPTSTTHYQWRKAIREATDDALSVTDPARDDLRTYKWQQVERLKAEYADWRKEQREAKENKS